jgi:HD superfamily phosphohydrolase
LSGDISIKDCIHGSVEVSAVESDIIGDKAFQRLRRIKALGFLDRVFPTAKHSRFEHSIGVMHVSGLLVKHIIQNTEALNNESWSKSSSFIVDLSIVKHIKEWKNVIRVAALLHDVGHGPFSHASEVIMPQLSDLIDNNKDIPEYLSTALKKRAKKEGADADHEDYSAILIWKILAPLMKKHPTEITDQFVRRVLSLKLCEYIEHGNDSDTALAKVFSQLVDGEFDADRMDYLLRDSFFCGVPYGKFDLERLLDGLVILSSNGKHEYTLAVKRSSLTAFEDFLFARFQMHVQIYTHRVDTSFNQALQTIVKSNNLSLPSKMEDYITFEDESFIHKFPDVKDLQNLILHREKWHVVFESFNPDNGMTGPIVEKLLSEINKDFISKKNSDKPIRKESLLKVPIVSKDFLGRYVTQEVKSISALISHYNTTFNVLRVVVHPSQVGKAKAILNHFQVDEQEVGILEMAETAAKKSKLGKEIENQKAQRTKKKVNQ